MILISDNLNVLQSTISVQQSEKYNKLPRHIKSKYV